MTPDICPYCSRLMSVGIQPANRRICSLCGLGVKKKHKWMIGSDGRIRHRDCLRPTGNVETNKAKGMFDNE